MRSGARGVSGRAATGLTIGRFDLAPEPNACVVHRSSNGVFFMASDAITTRLKKRARRIIEKIPSEYLPAWPGHTIGSSIVFPGNSVVSTGR